MTELETQAAARAQIQDRLRAMLVEHLQLDRAADELDPDAPLFGSGLGLDSLDAVEIVVWLESDFGLRVADPIVLRQSFRSLDKLTDLVLARRGGA